jgi:hypothetical protein
VLWDAAKPEAAAVAVKQRLDSLLSADERDWHAIELAADDLSAAAALAKLEQQEAERHEAPGVA